MPIKPHPTDPDKMVLVRGEYILPKEWVGLTDHETEQIVDAYWNDPAMFIDAIEAKLKEKNGNKSICD